MTNESKKMPPGNAKKRRRVAKIAEKKDD